MKQYQPKVRTLKLLDRIKIKKKQAKFETFVKALQFLFVLSHVPNQLDNLLTGIYSLAHDISPYLFFENEMFIARNLRKRLKQATLILSCLVLFYVTNLIDLTFETQVPLFNPLKQPEYQKTYALSTSNNLNSNGASLAQLETNRKSMISSCPKKYITFKPFGRLNNNIEELTRVIAVSLILNRTVVITDQIVQSMGITNSKLSSMFEINGFCIIEESEDSFKEMLSSKPSVISWQWGDGWDVSFKGISTTQVEMNTTECRRGLLYPDLTCLAGEMKKYDNYEIYHFPNIFYTFLDKNIFKMILRQIKFSPKIIEEGDNFIQKFSQNEFIGVHIRWLEGKCKKDVETIFKGYDLQTKEQARWMCDLTLDKLTKILKSRGINIANYKIFLASDGQNINAENSLLSSENVYKYTRQNVLVDMYILTKSKYFVGLQRSTLAYNVAKMREANGHDYNTNIMPGYKSQDQQELFLIPT